jgi:hypothetical protein
VHSVVRDRESVLARLSRGVSNHAVSKLELEKQGDSWSFQFKVPATTCLTFLVQRWKHGSSSDGHPMPMNKLVSEGVSITEFGNVGAHGCRDSLPREMRFRVDQSDRGPKRINHSSDLSKSLERRATALLDMVDPTVGQVNVL